MLTHYFSVATVEESTGTRSYCALSLPRGDVWMLKLFFFPVYWIEVTQPHLAAQLAGLVFSCAEEREVIIYGLAQKLYHTLHGWPWCGPLCIHGLSSEYPWDLVLLLH